MLGLLAILGGAVPQPTLGAPVDVAFTARVDGTTQRYVKMLPEGFDPKQSHALVVALHGHGSDRWQYVREERDECRAVRDWAARHDIIFISPDYRATTSWMGPKAEADVVQMLRDLRREYRVGKVFLAGGSMGGASALTFAALHPDMVAGVSSVNGTANHLEYRNFQEAIAESFGGTRKQVPQEYRKRSAEHRPERLTMPVGLAVGGRDELVPPQSVMRLADALRRRKRSVLLIHRPEGGHATDYADTMATLEFIFREAR